MKEETKVNVLAVIFILLVACGIWKGFKNGLANEINGLLSLFMALIVISTALLLLGGILQKNTKVIVISAVILVIVSFLYRLLGMLMKSIETVAKLPLISLVNRLAGAIAGALEIFIIFWMIYIIVDSFPTGMFGKRIMEWTEESALLMSIYNRNYIANWIMGLGL